jgi:antitoxin component of MazEF toxin-antitoxin module
MRRNGSTNPKRAVVALDGSVYFIRRLTPFNNVCGVYIPRQLLSAANLQAGDALQLWFQNGVICIKRLEIVSMRERLIPMPPRGRRGDTVPPDDQA